MHSQLAKLAKSGVLPRDSLKNDLGELKELLRRAYVLRRRKGRHLFYELSPKALPLLEEWRQVLWHKACLAHQVTPQSKFYRALVEDLRFLDEQHPLAEKFRFLGDWQLKRPVVPSQLELAKRRYYAERDMK